MIKLHAICKSSQTGEVLPFTVFCLAVYFKILYLLLKFESNEITVQYIWQEYFKASLHMCMQGLRKAQESQSELHSIGWETIWAFNNQSDILLLQQSTCDIISDILWDMSMV